jgi:hypothetical protein
MVTQDVDFVVATQSIGKAVERLEAGGFRLLTLRGVGGFERQFESEPATQHRDFASRAVPADVHGTLLRLASLRDTLAGKIKARKAVEGRQKKRIKDLGNISRLVESNPGFALNSRRNPKLRLSR